MAANPDQNPMFRKAVQPWYDTDLVCVLTAVFLVLVFLFALAGISVAGEIPDGGRYLWVPAVLLVLSAMGIMAIFYRLLRRYSHKFKKELP